MLYSELALDEHIFDTVNRNPSDSFPFSHIPFIKYCFDCYGKPCQDPAIPT